MDYATYYEQLEKGARYLASLASGAERKEHLGWANRYHRLAMDSRPGGVTLSVQAAA